MQKITVLGTDYTLQIVDRKEEPRLRTVEDLQGLCDFSTKNIYVVDLESERENDSVRDLHYVMKTVMRHEIVHAFLYESGFDGGLAEWKNGEQEVDWIALQTPKMSRVFKEAESYADKYREEHPIKPKVIDVDNTILDILNQKKEKIKTKKKEE